MLKDVCLRLVTYIIKWTAKQAITRHKQCMNTWSAVTDVHLISSFAVPRRDRWFWWRAGYMTTSRWPADIGDIVWRSFLLYFGGLIVRNVVTSVVQVCSVWCGCNSRRVDKMLFQEFFDHESVIWWSHSSISYKPEQRNIHRNNKLDNIINDNAII